MRSLIINADDFGQSAGINHGVAACHEAGTVSSASLMVRWPAARDAADYARRRPALSVGLHIDLGEWTQTAGQWAPLYEVIAMDDEAALRREVHQQLEQFRQLTGHDPTHLDSHQHVHLQPLVRGIVLDIAGRLGVSVRSCQPHIRYDGSFYGQGKHGEPCHDMIALDRFVAVVDALPEGITELACHPARGRDVASVYSAEREMETAVLCDPRAAAAIAARGVTLTSFQQIAANTAHGAARRYFDGLWRDGDPWQLATSSYDQGKYARELALLGSRRYDRVLEIGCGAGAFTRRLATIAGQVVAIDVSAAAIEQARAAANDPRIDYRVADAAAIDPAAEGPWDLVVLSETIYYVGWQSSFFEVGWLARRLAESLREDGRLLMTNTLGGDGHVLQMKSLLDTYRDLFVNSGLTLEHAETYRGDKNGMTLEALLTLFRKC